MEAAAQTPGTPRGARSQPPRDRHGGQRRGRRRTPSSNRVRPGRACGRAAGCGSRRPRGAVCSTTGPRCSSSRGRPSGRACTTRRSTHARPRTRPATWSTTAARSALVSRLPRWATRERGTSTCPAGRAFVAVDGDIDGFESLDDVRRRRHRPSRSTTSAKVRRCSTRRARRGAPRACAGSSPAQPFGDRRPRRPAARRRVRGSAQDKVYLSPAPLYHSAPLGVVDDGAPLRRHASCVMERFDARGVPRRSSSGTGHPRASSCPRCSCAC